MNVPENPPFRCDSIDSPPSETSYLGDERFSIRFTMRQKVLTAQPLIREQRCRQALPKKQRCIQLSPKNNDVFNYPQGTKMSSDISKGHRCLELAFKGTKMTSIILMEQTCH
ncbi:hypothetical protein WN55_07658 [Dufourea novaeangliae]|uniref:Uncharacterized protein n=1 Tax=Dufourea novaeangliae TaxID=178035 RepID=A0A154P5U7_DUFNO|nr:hypothetical protein WN55_07658 [Dufourea novaeangliae]